MYKDVLNSIEGIELYPVISLLIFFLFFVGLFIWMVKVDKSYLKTMAQLPLDRKPTSENLQQ